MSEFTWERYESLFLMLLIGVADKDEDEIENAIKKLTPEEFTTKVQAGMTKRLGNRSAGESLSLFNKRDILINNISTKFTSNKSSQLYDKYEDAENKYKSGNQGEAWSLLIALEIDLYNVSNIEERCLLSILVADTYTTMSHHYESSYLCLACVNADGIPQSSPLLGVAYSMLGDIAVQKRNYNIALVQYARAHDIWEENSKPDCQAIIQSDIARTKLLLGDYQSALSEIVKSVSLARKHKSVDSLAYCQLTGIELASLMRDMELAKLKLDEYLVESKEQSILNDSHWEKLVFAKYYVERSDFKQCLIELLDVCLFLKQFGRHEHMPDAMVFLAQYLNYEGEHDESMSCLLECYDLYSQLKPYRFSLFLKWLHTIEVSLRGTEKVALADKASYLILKYLDYNIVEVKNSILNRTGWWQKSNLLNDFINDLRDISPRYFSRYGLRINLYSGEVFSDQSTETPIHTLTSNRVDVFRMFATNQGTAFGNVDIYLSYRTDMIEYYGDDKKKMKEEIPRVDNHYTLVLQRLFTKLCGQPIVEKHSGPGYYIPKL